MKTSELTGAALDWAVAVAEGKDNDCEIPAGNVLYGRVTSGFIHYQPSTGWAQGGPIIEREGITLDYDAYDTDKMWQARRYAFDGTLLHNEYGPTPLIAAMRCYVASKLGDNIDIPEELK